MIVCDTCLSNDVELQEWVNPNTSKVSRGEPPYSDFDSAQLCGKSYCNECCEHTLLREATDQEERMHKLLAQAHEQKRAVTAALDWMAEEYSHNPDDDSSIPELVNRVEKAFGWKPTDFSEVG
jgi:hypothetical protein